MDPLQKAKIDIKMKIVEKKPYLSTLKYGHKSWQECNINVLHSHKIWPYVMARMQYQCLIQPPVFSEGWWQVELNGILAENQSRLFCLVTYPLS